MMLDTLAPTGLQVLAVLFLMFFTIKSPIESVVGGGAVVEENFIRCVRVDADGQVEQGAGARSGTGVNTGIEQRVLGREGCCMTGGGIRGNSELWEPQDGWEDGG